MKTLLDRISHHLHAQADAKLFGNKHGSNLVYHLHQGRRHAANDHSVQQHQFDMLHRLERQDKLEHLAHLTRVGFFGVFAVGLLLLSLSGCSKTSDSSTANTAATTLGTDVDDTVLTSRVKSALLADADVKSMPIMVETRKGQVMLSGFVDNQMQIERGVKVAQAVTGVKGVENKLSIKNSGQTVGSKIDDGVVTMAVKSALVNDEAMKSMDVAVITNKGEVQLSGFVDNSIQVSRAASLAQGVAGVTSVVNQLEVKK